ncbi:MAG: hypothetical protein GY797_40095, partial [Deltaproteobacteria bacterium]|nr:hypothetical protein [Deltaproteobacteria bacterium]
MCKIAKGLGIILIFIGPIVGLSISFLYLSWDQWQLSTDLESRGVSTQALIVKCNRDRGSHDITYEFEVEEGSQTGDMPATKQTYRNREYASSRCNDVGTMIAIKYVPEDPTRSSSSEEYNRKWAKIFFYMSFFPPLIFVLMILGIYPGGPRSPGVPIKKLKAKLGRAVGTSTVDWLQLLLFMALLGGFCFLLLSYFKNSWQLHLTL